MSAIAVLLQVFGCLGFGAAALRALRIDSDLAPAEHWTLAFVTGMGVLGWLMFPLGIAGFLSETVLAVVLLAGAAMALLLRRAGTPFRAARFDLTGKALLALGGFVLLFDALEGIAPPADADTLAYHFAVPQQFVNAGRIDFILEPLNGAIPLLVHMTYIPVMVLGGELGATLWTMLSGWATAALLFVLCRRHLGVNWSLAVALVFLTAPAIIYGAGSGQVETRLAAFAMLSAWAASRAIETGRGSYAILAGLGAGLFAAAKYTGLLFAAVTGVVVLFQRRWLLHGALFAVALLAAGFQWYTWNALHTGDPVFPMLFQWLGRDDLALWPKAHDLVFKDFYFHVENPLPKNLGWLLLFPLKATVNPAGLPDAGRVGLGPFGLLVLPFAVAGAWRFRDRIRRSPLFAYGAVALLFYVVWFFGGGSLRVRHLVPVLPLVLICLTAAAERLTADKRYRGPLWVSAAATLAIQAAGAGVFGLNYLKHAAGGFDREAFLVRNVNAYAAVPWINANLKGGDRLFMQERQLRYYLNVPSLFVSPLQAAVEFRPDHTDGRRFIRELRAAGVTHMLVSRRAHETTGSQKTFETLDTGGCLEVLTRIEARKHLSRTLPGLSDSPVVLDVRRVKGPGCFD